MNGLRYDKIIKYVIDAKCNGPLHIGGALDSNEDVLVHPVTNAPFIQASSVAGALRGYTEKYIDIDADILFGARNTKKELSTTEQQSRVKFSDGIFDLDTLKMELRPHVKINRQTGSVTSSKSSGQKFNMEYIGVGSEFRMTMYLFVDTTDTENDFESAVLEMLSAMKSGAICLGAKKSSGAGKIIPIAVKCRRFDMKNVKERKLWSDEEYLEDNMYEDILSSIPIMSKTHDAYKVIVKGKTESAMLVKGLGISEFGEGAPDCQNIRNASKEYIIPGSSIRGAIRSQMEKISEYLGKNAVIYNSFGKVGENEDEGYSGNLFFMDSVIGDREMNDKVGLRHRIHIDKLTGGVIQQGLFAEKNAFGDIELEMTIKNNNNPDATLGLLLLAIRDLASKVMNLGSGYATGKGFIDVSEISICSSNGVAKILYEDELIIEDNSKIIQKAVAALKEV